MPAKTTGRGRKKPVSRAKKMRTVEVAGTIFKVPDDAPDTSKTVKPNSRFPLGKSGLSLYPFLCKLFEMNEQLEQRDKLHDGHLELLIRNEFSEVPEIIHSIENSSRSRIAIWRSQFNTGYLRQEDGQPRPPDFYSFKFNIKGQPVNAYGRRLTPADLRERAAPYRVHVETHNAATRPD